MKRLVPEDMETGIPEIDRYMKEQIGGFIEDFLDEAAFFDALEDCDNLSRLGLYGKLIEQSPEFVRKMSSKDIVFYHLFILHTNETGVHIVIPEDITDTEVKQYLLGELE